MTFLEELGAALHWPPQRVAVMLWAYVDDSNIHERGSGKVETIGMGGAIASFYSWQLLEDSWQKELDRERIESFHMTDFESYNKQFKGWSEGRHKRLLNTLLCIIRTNVSAYVGYSVPASPGKEFTETYKAALGRMLHYCGQTALTLGETKVSLVFAHQPQVKSGRIASFLDLARGAFPEIASFTGASPNECCALQAADLLAYELVRWRGVPDVTGARYPIRHLMSDPIPPHQVFDALSF
jgi:hypothetical protein